jgi:diguanylate cyclase (GGDEF)-like protein/PAS domain S-box-containing protein
VSQPRPESARAPSRRAAPFHLLVLAVAVVSLSIGLARTPDGFLHPRYLLWVALIGLTELRPIPVWREARLQLSFPLSVAAAILYPPAIAGLIAFLGSFDPREARREIPLSRALFNRSQIALATMVVGLTFHSLVRNGVDSSFAVLLLVAALAGAIGYMVNVMLVTIAMSLDYEVGAIDVLRKLRIGGVTQFLITYFGLGLIGPVLARLYSEVGPAAVLILAGPALLAKLAYSRSLALEDAEARYKELVERVPTASYIRATDGTASTLYVSPQIEAMLGYAPEQWLQDPQLWSRILHPLDRERVLAAQARANVGGDRFLQEYRVMAKDGQRVWVRDEAKLVLDGRPEQSWHGVILDISGGTHADDQTSFLAYHDNLTELPNRAMFKEVLALALNRARRKALSVALLYVDLDNFKLVNDRLGHNAGDDLLRQVATRLLSAGRDADLVGRQGGDEFLVILADLDLHGSQSVATRVAGRIHTALRRGFLVDGTEISVSASIGISIFPFDASDEIEMLSNADSAMYRSKRAGPGGTTLLHRDERDSLSDLSLAARLPRAAEQSQWLLHYQPIVNIQDGALLGVEALIRWNDPELGLILPDRFIPLAEEMRLISRIDDWALEQLCNQLRLWRRDGIEMVGSFNLSLCRLWEPDVARHVAGTVESHGLAPSNVIIEITESTAMADPDLTKRVLADLHARGLRVAIDDFGTAYSSLSRLNDLEVDVLKIAAPFVQGAPESAKAAKMLAAIVGLARAVGIEPVGEGIESVRQGQYLIERGCTKGQGFLFSPPVPAEAIPALVPSAA